MNCQELQERIQSGGAMNKASEAHLENCAGCRRFAEDENALSEMFARLPRKDAPADFDFRVRARIAEEKEPRSWVWAAARIGLPSAALALIVGMAVLNSSLFNSGGDSAGTGLEIVGDPGKRPVFKIEEVDKEQNDARTVETGAPDAVAKSATGREPAAVAKKSDGPVIPPAGSPRRPGEDQKPAVEIRSIDQGAEEPEVMNPPGLDPERKILPRLSDQKKKFSFVEILSALGISAFWDDEMLFVSDVATRSTGERAGVKKGDLILAIDGVAVSQKPIRGGVVSGSSISISRAGRRMLIKIGARD